jgi:hypothetical protein
VKTAFIVVKLHSNSENCIHNSKTAITTINNIRKWYKRTNQICWDGLVTLKIRPHNLLRLSHHKIQVTMNPHPFEPLVAFHVWSLVESDIGPAGSSPPITMHKLPWSRLLITSVRTPNYCWLWRTHDLLACFLVMIILYVGGPFICKMLIKSGYQR